MKFQCGHIHLVFENSVHQFAFAGDGRYFIKMNDKLLIFFVQNYIQLYGTNDYVIIYYFILDRKQNANM